MPQQKKILIVDDEQPIRKILRRYLEKAGYQCITAENTASAKKIMTSESFDLLLTDLLMPGESGLDLIKHAKKHYPKTGRIMITALSSQDVATEVMEIGVYGYIVKPLLKNVVLITVENALRHLALDIDMQVYVSKMADKVIHRTAKLDAIMNNINLGIMMVDTEMNILEMNHKMREWYSVTKDIDTKHCFEVLVNPIRTQVCDDCPVIETFKDGKTCDINKQLQINQETRDFRIITTPVFDKDRQISAAICLYEDISERLQIEKDLHQAQKLESVGQLAAGIAHEINTPVQYIGDNLSFIKDSFDDINSVLENFEKIWPEIKKGNEVSENLIKAVDEAREEADLEYLAEEVPVTIQQSLDGVRRVDKIVKAMKDFSHPGDEEKVPTDINKIIETTLTVCKNEWKYVAEIEKNFSTDLPYIPCFPGDLSQVFLNIIVNAAHAINDVTEGGNKSKGKISIQTHPQEDYIQILITDTGGGIPEEVKTRVFDPFFTTKERGKGTGQGLAIAHRVVEKKHQGSLSFDTRSGEGTTFIIQLPTS